MRVLFYVPNSLPEVLETLKEEAKKPLEAVAVNWCTNISDLFLVLRKSDAVDTVYVLFAESKEALDRLCSMDRLLDNRKIILVLPTQNKLLTDKGYTLNPKHITYLDGNWVNVVTVAGELSGCIKRIPKTTLKTPYGIRKKTVQMKNWGKGRIT